MAEQNENDNDAAALAEVREILGSSFMATVEDAAKNISEGPEEARVEAYVAAAEQIARTIPLEGCPIERLVELMTKMMQDSGETLD